MHKRRGLSQLGKITAITGAAVVLAASSATAHVDTSVQDGGIDNAKATHGHDAQHDGAEGHLPPVQEGGLSLVSKTRLSNVVPGKIADVGVLGTTAYLAAWGGQTCENNGVHIVDIADVTAPREIGFIKSKEGSYSGEGVQALPISTPAFNGNLLVTNNEQCKPGVGFGGINLYDVTNPLEPIPLAVGFGDDSGQTGQGKKAAHETHSVFAWDAGSKAYAVMVDNAEAADIDIVDITNPKKPVFIAEYDLASFVDRKGNRISLQKGLPEVFLHDMVVKQVGGRQIMLASYWDGGYVQLDVTDPKAALVMSDSDFAMIDPQGAEGTAPPENYEDGVQGTPLLAQGKPVPPEGNAHQAEFAGPGDRYVLGADEDFSPYALTASTDDGTALTAGQGSGTPPLASGDTLSGQAVFFGRGCLGDPTAPAGNGTQIAVVERGLCTFTEKVASVERVGGYAAVLIFNRTGSDGCDGSLGMSVEGHIPAFGVAPRGQGFGIFDQPYSNADCLNGTGASVASPVAVGTAGDTLSFSSYFDGWGYVRLLDSSTMKELDTYAIPEAHDPARAEDSGDLSVHEVATSAKNSNLAYVSYYAGGVRVVDVSTGKIQEKAAFIDQGGNNFWGVEVFSSGGKEYVAASDRDLGLYIFEYTPANRP